MSDFTLTIQGRPDSQGRCRFTLEWEGNGDYRPQPHPADGEPVGHRRGQCYQANPTETAERLRRRGHQVEVIDPDDALRQWVRRGAAGL